MTVSYINVSVKTDNLLLAILYNCYSTINVAVSFP